MVKTTRLYSKLVQNYFFKTNDSSHIFHSQNNTTKLSNPPQWPIRLTLGVAVTTNFFLQLSLHFSHQKFSFAGVFSGKAPRIVEHPTDMMVMLHEPATLNCKSEGDPKPDVRWFRDGRPVDLASSVRKALLPDGSLLFLEATQGKRDSDSGAYWCIATNSFGEATSRKANLIVTCK